LVLPMKISKKELINGLPESLAQDCARHILNVMICAEFARVQMYEHFEKEIGDEFAELKGEYDEAFTMALHKDVRDGIVKETSVPMAVS
jgi:hypothetical protein